MHIVFFVCALASIAAVVLICLFLFANGIPAMKEIGLLNFLTGAKWKYFTAKASQTVRLGCFLYAR